MSNPHLDADVVAEGIHWFKGYGPLPVVGPCPHTCEHGSTSVVAWGPDYDHYCLVDCDGRDGCGCRGWTREYPSPFTGGPKYEQHGWKQVERPRPHAELGADDE